MWILMCILGYVLQITICSNMHAIRFFTKRYHTAHGFQVLHDAVLAQISAKKPELYGLYKAFGNS